MEIDGTIEGKVENSEYAHTLLSNGDGDDLLYGRNTEYLPKSQYNPK